MKKSGKDVIVVGFALFAMFFGAGNLIFPPSLGVLTGDSWITAFTGFIIADVGIALLALLAIAKNQGNIESLFSRAGHKFSIILISAMMICMGPLLAIPRTGATTFEMAIQPIFSGFSPLLCSIIFFGLTFILSIKPSKVVDIIGGYLTPTLLVALLALIVIGVVNPLGTIEPSKINNVFSEGIFQGYQTLDGLGAVALSAVLFVTIAEKGYTEQKEKLGIIVKAGIVAGIGLIIVYGGLAYLGATVSGIYDANVSQATLIVSITEMLIGAPGKIMLGIIVSLACLTTSIGLTSAVGQYFSKLTNNKAKYEVIVTVVCLFSLVMANLGVGAIIKIAAPVLSIIYPPTIMLVVLTLVVPNIKNDNVFKFGAYMALFMGILNIMSSFGVAVPVINSLPLASLGFNWVTPVALASVVGYFVKSNNSDSDRKQITA